MIEKKIQISGSDVRYCFRASIRALKQYCHPDSTVVVTDKNVYSAHSDKLDGWKTIVIPAGEQEKQQHTVDGIIDRLMELEADRQFTLVGMGGGVVTDMTGYAASVYMRGIRVGFIPTTLLAMVDASIGGKNGVDIGTYKNLVGTIRQPDFLIYDTDLLQTLPEPEWRNGFAEIIKHAAIRDAAMFTRLEKNELSFFRENREALNELMEQNAMLKTRVVQRDPFEKGIRKWLNFGHTLGHAIENQIGMAHGEAVAVGMSFAALASEQLLQFKGRHRLIKTIRQYGLPVHVSFQTEQALHQVRMDKKRMRDQIQFVLLKAIGKPVVEALPFTRISDLMHQFQSDNQHS